MKDAAVVAVHLVSVVPSKDAATLAVNPVSDPPKTVAVFPHAAQVAHRPAAQVVKTQLNPAVAATARQTVLPVARILRNQVAAEVVLPVALTLAAILQQQADVQVVEAAVAPDVRRVVIPLVATDAIQHVGPLARTHAEVIVTHHV